MVPDQRLTLVGVFGTPSCLMYWGVHVIRTIAGVIGGDYRCIHGAYLSEFADVTADRIGQSSTICVSDCPELLVCNQFITSGAPIILLVESPRDVIEDLISAGHDHVDALRRVTRSLCALQPLFGAPNATVFGTGSLDGDLQSAIAAILTALGLSETDEHREAIDHVLALSRDRTTVRVRDHVNQLIPNFTKRGDDPSNSALLAASAIAEPYACLVAGEALASVEWPASIFSSGDTIGSYVRGPSELVGRARILVYGPYMHLSRGRWSAYVELEVSDNASGNRLKTEVVCGRMISASVIADMPVEGRYCFVVTFEVVEPLDPVELRFQIQSGAIEGRFLLTKVVMSAVEPEAVANAS